MSTKAGAEMVFWSVAHSLCPKRAHERIERLLVLLYERVQLLVVMLQTLVLRRHRSVHLFELAFIRLCVCTTVGFSE